MSESAKAVFLSYASQDVAAALRLCAALRAAGIEVWFDQDALVGGDAWDAKIRGQIASCALFVPVISAATQARGEGYFRLEWKLAVDRSHLMAHDQPFLLPVVIDDTPDAAARVPSEFKQVQWMRIGSADSLEAFGERVGKLLGSEVAPASDRRIASRETIFAGQPAQHRLKSGGGRPAEAAQRPARASGAHRVWLASTGALIVLSSATLWVWPHAKTSTPPTAAAPAAGPAQPAGDFANAKSLVVLPLENLSPDPENAFFTDGMHSEIIATLSRIPDLRVISRASALTLKGSALALGEAAKKIGVANVMTGSVRRAGPSVRIQLELRRASDEALLWSHTYAQELTDPLVLQSDIAENVARALQARESRGAYGGARFSTKSPQAFDLFLKARGLFEPGAMSGEGMLQSARLLKEALGLDPGFVSAASLLANIFTDLARGSPAPDQRVIHAAEAKLYAEMAARLAPGGAGDAQLALYYAVIEGEAAKALGLADNAIRALPNDAVHHNIRGLALRRLGRIAEALLSYGKARELDPLTPVFRSNELSSLLALRRWDEFAAANASNRGRNGASAAAWMRRAAYELKGELPTSLDGMSSSGRRTSLWRGRKFAEADIELEQARARSPVADAGRFALLCRHHDVLLRLGRADEAAKTAREAHEYAEMLQNVREVGLSNKALYLAQSLVRLGRNEEAIAAGRRYVEETSSTTQPGIRWLREAELAEIYAYAGRSREGVALLAKLLKVPVDGLTVPALRLDPAWDNLREDAGFKALLADPKNSAPL